MSCLEIVRVTAPVKEVVLRMTPEQAGYVMYCAGLCSSNLNPAATSLYMLLKSATKNELPINHGVRFA